MIAITSKYWLVEMWQMWKCENVKMWKCENVKMWQMIINGYEFWKSFCVAMYMSGGARRCSVQSPPTVCVCAVNICRLSLSISVGCRCQNLTLSPLSIFATAIIAPLPLCSHGSHGSHGSRGIQAIAIVVPLSLPFPCVVAVIIER